MGTTKIEWADAVWNPVSGCSKVSAGCANCYAERMANRFFPPWIVETHPSRLDQPLHWRKPRRVFVCSMGDLFHEDVPVAFIAQVFDVMAAAQQHVFMVLTKRPERMREAVSRGIGNEAGENMPGDSALSEAFEFEQWPLPNVWLGVSVENQDTADERIPLLLQTPAAVRFVSVEPMLGPVDLGYTFSPAYGEAGGRAALDWVICGGETGPGARPMHPDWPRSLRDQCVAAGVPFFFKHCGEWAKTGLDCTGIKHANRDGRPVLCPVLRLPDSPPKDMTEALGCLQYMERVGKKAAGRLLDGREWNEFPKEKP